MAQSKATGIFKIDPRLNHSEPTYFPLNEQNLADALSSISKSGFAVQIVYPGTQAPATLSAGAGVVINISNLNQIRVEEDKVRVGVSTSIASLVSALKAHDLFLPLSDVPSNTVLESLSDDISGYFDRTVGRLNSFVSEVNVVSMKGGLQTLKLESDGPKVESLLKGTDASFIVTSVVFETIPLKRVSDLWLARLAFPYSKPGWDALTERVFGADNSNNMDVTVQTAKVFGGLGVIFLTIVSRDSFNDSTDTIGKLTQLHEKAVKVTGESVVRGSAVLGAAQIAQDVSRRTWNRELTSGSIVVTPSERSEKMHQISDLVHDAFGVTETHVRLQSRLSLSLRLSNGPDQELIVHGQLRMPKIRIRSEESQYAIKFNSFFPSPTVPSFLLTTLTPESDAPIVPKPDFSVVTSLIQPKEAHIPNFSGPTYMQGDEDYTEAATQYATTSYPPERSNPFIVGYPQTVQDIKVAVDFAKANGKSVVARSGGHQYSCLSGGDQSVIVLSMERFSYASIKEGDVPNLCVVGSGTPLTHISEFLTENHLTVPHGECPLVNAGGHTQSGGYGHTLRSQGLLVDYVRSFRIVLADTSYVQVYRPNVSATDKHEKNDDIFYGVLGGSPGSFGIVTEYTFEGVHDDDHSYSTGLSGVYMYSRSRFMNIMQEVKEWTQGIKDGTLQGDMDLMASAISFDWENMYPADWHDPGAVPGSPPPDAQPEEQSLAAVQSSSGRLRGDKPSLFDAGFLLLELLYGNQSGQPDSTVPPTKDRFHAIHERVISDDPFLILPSYMLDFDSDEHHDLSYMCDSWVRRWGTTLDGREFVYPYKKRLNGTFEPLSDEFVTGFVDLVTEAIFDRRVRIVYQMVLGGGMHSENVNRQYTSCSRRDITIGVVFDVFYTEGNEATAKKYQDDMKELLDSTVPEKDQVRLFWGSFGDTNLNNVWENYYDSANQYSRLQGIKSAVDGMDVFHTEFTVQLPSS